MQPGGKLPPVETGSERRGGDRLLLLKLLVGIVPLILIGRLWYLQMIRGEDYRVLADRNRFREVDVAAARGVIYDRNGEILARNRPSFSVVIVPADLPEDQEAVLNRLNGLLSQPIPSPGPSPTPSRNGDGTLQPGASSTAKTAPKVKTKSVLDAPPDRQPWMMPRPEV